MQISKDIEDELRSSPDVDATDIAVTVRNGSMELAGFVKSYGDKFSADTAAKRVPGVVGLANDLDVRLAFVDQRADPDVVRDAVSAIGYWLPPSTNVKPIVQNGWATLEGTVEWYNQKEDAETAVRRLKGVKGVSNMIQIEPQAAPSEIKRKIEDAFRRNAAIDATRMWIGVQF